MQAKLVGRIGNTRLPVQQALLPLYEAIVNSIHSCSELGHNGDAKIDVELIRNAGQGTIEEVAVQNPVETFVVTDNGPGFNDANFESFQTADSRHRRSIGGKGIGRFLWLVAFDHAEIDSTFQNKDGDWLRRTFTLRLTKEGVEDHVLSKTSETRRSTTVRLVGAKRSIRRLCPKAP